MGGSSTEASQPATLESNDRASTAITTKDDPLAVELDDFGLPLKRLLPPTSNTTDAIKHATLESKDEAKDKHEQETAAAGPADRIQAIHSSKPDEPSTGPEDLASERKSRSGGTAGKDHGPVAEVAKASSPEHDATLPLPMASPKEVSNDGKKDISSVSTLQNTLQDTNSTTAETQQHLPVTDPVPRVDILPTVADTSSGVAHKREMSIASIVDGATVSDFSHQQLPNVTKPEQSEDEGWQQMPAYARYDMYDDDDRLIARERIDEDEERYGYNDLGGAGKGYTRVMMDEDAQSATSMDDQTQYLFKEAQPSTSLTGAEEDEVRDAVSQMQATKDLLTEGQRIAYVGIVRLELAILLQENEDLEKTRWTKKEVAVAAESGKMWGQKMMIRLYAHMDISEAEQIMIEQLAAHGVVSGDLTPALLVNSTVRNPMAKGRQSLDKSSIHDLDKTNLPPYPAEGGEEEAAEPPPPYEKREGEEMPDVKAPSELPKTEKIDIDLRWTVLCDLFLVLIADSVYDARSRLLLERVGKAMDVQWIDLCRFEKRVTDALEMQQAAEKENWNEDEHMEARRKMALKRRYVMMGLATVGGGLVIGLSAGLLAPVIGAGLAAGFTTIGVGGTSSFLAGAGGAAIITSGAAASGSFIGGKAAHNRTGAVKTFEYRPLHNNKRVNLIVTVSGWLTGKVDDVRLPFSTVNPIMGDVYSVLWEPEMLRSMGDTINILATEALTQGLQQVLGSTILISLMAALQLPIVLTKLSYLIDNPWAVSLDRAISAGQILADSLMERSLGTRPITLVGYSLGSRVIFSCLQELAKKGAYGLIQNVYIFGSPIVVKKDEYLRAKTVVHGRFVNGYNRNDWILGYLFRLTSGGIRRIAGLAAIEDMPWIENMDVTDTVLGHMEYRKMMPKLLKDCGWDVESEEFTEIEDPDPENHQGRQRELINEIEEARKELENEGKAKQAKFGFFSRRKRAEKKEWEVYEDSAAKDQETGKAEKPISNNHGVLFDVDAIRAELAKEADDPDAFQIREIESTLPPMKLDLPSGTTSPGSSLYTPAASHGWGSTAGRSVDTLPIQRPSYESNTSWQSKQLSSTNGRSVSAQNLSRSPMNGRAGDGAYATLGRTLSKDAVAPTSGSPQSRKETKASQAVPNITLSDPWADPDDEDFGKEQEISMTFA